MFVLIAATLAIAVVAAIAGIRAAGFSRNAWRQPSGRRLRNLGPLRRLGRGNRPQPVGGSEGYVRIGGLASRAALQLLVIAAVIALPSCVTTEGFNNPTLPASQWHLFSNLDLGYALALPQHWSAFDLNTEIDSATESCAQDGQLKDARRQQLTDLHTRGVRLFACDTSRAGDPRLPIAYAVAGRVPPEGLDKYLDNIKLPAGRDLLDRRHVKTNAGDMVLQKVHERLTAQDGSALDTMQYQFLVVRFNALHLFFVEFQTAIQDTMDHDAQLIGTSLTPLH